MLSDYSSFLYTFHLNVTCSDPRANQGKLSNSDATDDGA
jgi:hypothetical protein